MKRTSVTVMAVLVLLLSMLAGPAVAQQVGDTFDGTPAEVCALAVAESYRVQNPDVFEAEFAGLFDGEDVIDDQDLIDTVVAFLEARGQTLEGVCSIYIGVLPDLEENGDNGVDDDEEVSEVDERAEEADEEAPSIVLGTTLARTGVDTMLLVLGALLLLGLGVVALRRTKSDTNVS